MNALGPATEQEVANFIGKKFYISLLQEFKKIAAQNTQSLSLETIKEQAKHSWNQTIKVLEERDHDAVLASHIRKVILPMVESTTRAVDSLFLLFFFYNRNANKVRFWCPSDSDIRESLKFPYDNQDVISGIGTVRGLKDWEFPLTGEGLGTPETKYFPDLTGRNVLYPKGDWLAGIKCSLYLDISEDRHQQSGVILCACSWLPFLFGKEEKSYADAPQFFNEVKDAINESAASIKLTDICTWLGKITVTADENQVETWLHNTAGLAHKFRPEINRSLRLCEDLLKFIQGDTATVPVLSGQEQSPEAKVRYIRASMDEWSRFLEFLNVFAKGQLGRSFSQDEWEKRLGFLSIQTADVLKKVVTSLYDRVADFFREEFYRTAPTLKFEIPESFAVGILGTGVISFIFHEFLTNAVRYGPRDRSVIFRAAAVDSSSNKQVLSFQVINELQCEGPKKGLCSSENCIHISSDEQTNLYRTAFLSTKYYCADCLKRLTAEWLHNEIWKPGIGAGTGLGLFLIKLYAERFYGGSFTPDITLWEDNIRQVVFGFTVPQEGLNGRQNWRPL